MSAGDNSVTIYYSSSVAGASASGYTGSTMNGELTVTTTGAFRAVGYNTIDPVYPPSQSESAYGTSCSVSFGYYDETTPNITYEARSSYSSHSCYVTVVGYWTGSSETNGVNSYYDEETDTTYIYTVSSSYSIN